MARVWFAAVGFAVAAIGCSPTGADDAGVTNGSWGGAHIRLMVTNTGAAAEFDCAHGTIDAPLTLDKSGQFDISGTLTVDGPGPVIPDRPSQPRPARYDGRLNGSVLTLTITLTDTNDSAGTFTLRRGGTANLTKCL